MLNLRGLGDDLDPNGQISRATGDALSLRAKRIATWLRQRSAELLWPTPEHGRVEEALARGLVAACSGEWSALSAEPPEQSTGTVLRRIAPRVLTAALLVAVALVIPQEVAQGAEASALRVTLLLLAARAAFAPEQSLGDAITSLKPSTKEP